MVSERVRLESIRSEIEGRARTDLLGDFDVSFLIEDFKERGIVPTNAQAIALVKKLRLSLTAEHQGGWIVNRNIGEVEVRNRDANRAIVECCAKAQVAKMQEAET